MFFNKRERAGDVDVSGLHGRVLENGVSSGCRGYKGYTGITCDSGGSR